METTTASTTPHVTLTREAVSVHLVSQDGIARSSQVGVPCIISVYKHTHTHTHKHTHGVQIKVTLPLLPTIASDCFLWCSFAEQLKHSPLPL